MDRMTKAEDWSTAYKKTLLGYRGLILDPDGKVFFTSKKRFKTAKLAKDFADRTLSMNAAIAANKIEND